MKIFVISLKRSLERRSAIQKQMENYGINFEFIDAVDGYNLTLEQKNRVDYSLIQWRYPEMTNGEIGCAMSHAITYEKIVRENIEHAIIMEDDAIIPDSAFKEILEQKLLEQSGKDIVLLYSNSNYVFPWKKSSEFFYNDKMLYTPAFSPGGAVAYYVNQHTAKKLHEATRKISFPSDWCYPIHRLNLNVILPPVITHPHLVDVMHHDSLSPQQIEEWEQQTTIKSRRGKETNLKNIWFRIPRILKKIITNNIWDYMCDIFLKRFLVKIG